MLTAPPLTLTFTVAFHGPFRVGSGRAEGLADATVDRAAVLPASSVKGLMRAEARKRLGIPEELVGRVFGGPSGADGPGESPWAWSDCRVEHRIGLAARVAIDEATGAARPGALQFGELVWAAGPGVFTVDLRRWLAEEELAAHRCLLRAAARSVTAVGAQRRRGLGWVGIEDDHPWTQADSALLLRLGEAGR